MMKKIVLLTFLLTAFFSSLSMAQNTSFSISRNSDGYALQIKDGTQNLQVKLKGDILFTDDEKDIEKIAPGSNIFYKKKNDKLEITSDRNNSPVYTINGTKKTTLETADKNLIAQCIQLMIDNGVGAEERAAKLYKQGGFPVVLKAIDRLNSDYVRSIYLNYLDDNHTPTNDEMLSFLNKIDTYLPSDYYKSTLLNNIQDNYLKKDVTANAYLQSVKNIQSDYYKANTLKKILNASLSEKQFEQVLPMVGSIKSDYYQSDVLKMILSKNTLSDTTFTQMLNAASHIKSDYYLSDMISSLLKNESLGKNRYSQTVAAMQNMKSTYYQASVLENLINNNVTDESEWLKLLAYVNSVGSDYEKANVLIKIADSMPVKNQKIQEAFTQSAKTIHSDHDYGRVMRAMKND